MTGLYVLSLLVLLAAGIAPWLVQRFPRIGARQTSSREWFAAHPFVVLVLGAAYGALLGIVVSWLVDDLTPHMSAMVAALSFVSAVFFWWIHCWCRYACAQMVETHYAPLAALMLISTLAAGVAVLPSADDFAGTCLPMAAVFGSSTDYGLVALKDEICRDRGAFQLVAGVTIIVAAIWVERILWHLWTGGQATGSDS